MENKDFDINVNEVESRIISAFKRERENIEADIRVSVLKRFCPRLLLHYKDIEEKESNITYPEILHTGIEKIIEDAFRDDYTVKIEKRFYYVIEDTNFNTEIVISGKPDIVLLKEDKFYIIDIKTRGIKDADYNQISLYAYFLKRITNMTPGRLFLLKPNGDYLDFGYDEETDYKIEKELEGTLEYYLDGADIMIENRRMCEGCPLEAYCYAEEDVGEVENDAEVIKEAYIKLLEYREQKNELEKHIDGLRNLIISRIPKAGVFDLGGLALRISEVEKENIDIPKLKSEFPEVYEKVVRKITYKLIK